jgi:hypothetical protein
VGGLIAAENETESANQQKRESKIPAEGRPVSEKFMVARLEQRP